MEANERLLRIESTVLILIYLTLINNSLVSGVSIKENIACYGNYHNFVKLECESPQVIINITQVLLGAKPVDKDCPTTTNTDNYKEECCRQEIGDCMIPTNSQVANRCFGLRLCEIQTIWALVADACQPKTYPRFTNFMSVQYQCGNHRDKPSITTTTVPTYTESSTLKSTNHPKVSVIKTESTTLRRTTLSDRTSSLETSPSSAFLVSKPKSSMTGIIIGISCGFLGMMLCALGLWIYCRRKNQSSSSSSKPISQPLPPPSHFLENILSYSKTRKSFCKGYNNFSNLMPSTNQVLTRRDGQHVQILRTPSDASDHSNQSPGPNTTSTSATVSTSVTSSPPPPSLLLSSTSDRSHPQGITILNNFTYT